MALQVESARHLTRTRLQMRIMIRIGEAFDDCIAQSFRCGRIAGSKMSIDAFFEPFGNTAHVISSDGNPVIPRLKANLAEWLRPKTRHDEQIDGF